MPTKYPERGEQQLATKAFRKFKGVVNDSARNALPEDAWFYLENIQPIGDANLQTVPGLSPALANYSAHGPYWSRYACINGTDYLITFCTDGSAQAFQIDAATTQQIAVPGTLSGVAAVGAGSRFDQWQNTAILIIDSTGFYTWAGTGQITLVVPNFTSTGSSITSNVLTIGTLTSGQVAVGQIITGGSITAGTSITSNISGSGSGSTWNITATANQSAEAISGSSGVPTSGNDIAVAFGRVWVVNGRSISFSAANGYLQGSWQVANGAGTVILTDPTIRNYVTRLIYLNGYLYIVAPTAINVISDVYVPSSASPPTPLFTNLNIQAIIGSDEPGSVFAFNQSLVFANHYGVWELTGTNATKVSSDIDGTWKYIDPSQVLCGGQVVVNQILCYGILLKRLNDPVFGSNQVVAMRHDEKWWFVNYGALTFIVSGLSTANALYDNTPLLFGFISGSLYQLMGVQYGITVTPPPTLAMTPLWGMEDELADKQVIRAGFEVTVTIQGSPFQMNVDGVNNSTTAISLSTSGGVPWTNVLGNIIPWTNKSGAVIPWTAGGYLLYNGTAPGVYSKYVGATIKTSASAYQLSSVFLDYKLRARWL